MWIKTEFKMREALSNVFLSDNKLSILQVVNGPDSNCICMVTVKYGMVGDPHKQVAKYMKDTGSFIINGADNTDFVIAYSYESEELAYDDGRRTENVFINRVQVPIYSFVNREIALDSLLLMRYLFNNITVEAKLFRGKEGVKIYISSYEDYDGRDVEKVVKDIDYNGPLCGLKPFVIRLIDYSSFIEYPSGYVDVAGVKKGMIPWNVCLQKVVDNVVQLPENCPKKSGRYLCTCVNGLEPTHKYIKMMEWNDDKKYWHDVGSCGCSAAILAWVEIDVCGFDGYEYNAGGYITAKM